MSTKAPVLAPWQERLIDEARELYTQRTKLANFMLARSETLPAAERIVLIEQYGLMARLEQVLRKRIAAFKAPG